MADSENRKYIAIDLKSFYASVECREAGLDPLNVNLVVADESRTEKTICLAVTPSLKAYGIPGRARLFEVIQRVREINAERRMRAPGGVLKGESVYRTELEADPSLAVAFRIAEPRMAYYMHYSSLIYRIYLQFVSPEDIHVYSIDEVFMDVTDYLKIYGITAEELARKMIRQVFFETGITAAAGIGTNLYLCKVAMDILAKHSPPDEYGVRIAELDERSYRERLWAHRPLTDFWRVGRGTARKLENNGIFTMGDIARCSLGKKNEFYNEDFLYKLFGVNAELLIDHAWGWEPCTIADIKAYRPESSSTGSGQVLPEPYESDMARVVVMEMAEALAMSLMEKKLVTDRLVLTVGYDRSNLQDPEIRSRYTGPVKTDYYGRMVPKSAHGTAHLSGRTNSSVRIIDKMMELFDEIVNPDLLVRRVYVTAEHVVDSEFLSEQPDTEQLDLFTDYEALQKEREDREKARDVQKAMLDIQRKYGKNSILKGASLRKGATMKERNGQIGGHKA